MHTARILAVLAVGIVIYRDDVAALLVGSGSMYGSNEAVHLPDAHPTQPATTKQGVKLSSDHQPELTAAHTTSTRPSNTVHVDPLGALLSKVQDRGVVVATTTDSGYLPLTVNWICHLRRLGLSDKVIVFALDEKTHQDMAAHGK